jgi:hypothetical protein
MSNDKSKKTLTDAEITTVRNTGRRAFLGAMGVAGVSAALVPVDASAQPITDADSEESRDQSGCGRGPGGVATGVSDEDNGNITDSFENGRGQPNC